MCQGDVNKKINQSLHKILIEVLTKPWSIIDTYASTYDFWNKNVDFKH